MFGKIKGAFGYGDQNGAASSPSNNEPNNDPARTPNTASINIQPLSQEDRKESVAEPLTAPVKPDNTKKAEETKGILAQISEGIQGVGGRLKDAVIDAGVGAKQAAVQAADNLVHNIIVEKVKDSFAALDQGTKSILRSVKGKLEEWVKLQIEKNIRSLLTKIPPAIKERIKDQHMCGCVKDLIDDLVDDIWPEIEDELVYELKFKLDYMEKFDMPEQTSKCCLCRCTWAVVAWYRYTTRPVDKNIWQRLKWFSFWILFIISLFPFYCVAPGLLLIDFLMIDKSDEYQLVEFVLGFKKLHFISFGIIRGVVGFTQYYACVNYGSFSEAHNACEDFGPGSGSIFLLELISLCIMCALAWIATLLLICSSKKGMPKFRYLQNPNEESESPQKKKSCLCVCCCPASLCKFWFLVCKQKIEAAGYGALLCMT